jgi:dihydrofolate reductase
MAQATHSSACVKTKIALVVAVADNGVIGRGGTLPWHLPDDLKHFKAVTMGKPVLMGRRTFESIGRPLPGRRNLVLTRTFRESPPGVQYVRSVDAALALVSDAAQLCVIGGAEVFALARSLATRVYLTQVHAVIPGDTCFPLGDLAAWSEVERMEHAADARHAHAMSFVTLERG